MVELGVRAVCGGGVGWAAPAQRAALADLIDLGVFEKAGLFHPLVGVLPRKEMA